MGGRHRCHCTDGDSKAQSSDVRGHGETADPGLNLRSGGLHRPCYYLLNNTAPVLLYKPGFSKMPPEIAEIMGKSN